MRIQAIGSSLLMVFAAAPTARAQSFVEHAAVSGPAAAGSTTGAMIGAKISAAFDATAEAASKAGSSAVKSARDPVPIAVGKKNRNASTSVSEPATPAVPKGATVVWRRGAEHTAHLRPAVRPPVEEAAPVLPAPRPLISREEMLVRLDSLRAGIPRADAMAAMGSPDSVLAMPDDAGGLVERMRFRANGEDVAVVEVRDGVVTSVARSDP